MIFSKTGSYLSTKKHLCNLENRGATLHIKDQGRGNKGSTQG